MSEAEQTKSVPPNPAQLAADATLESKGAAEKLLKDRPELAAKILAVAGDNTAILRLVAAERAAISEERESAAAATDEQPPTETPE